MCSAIARPFRSTGSFTTSAKGVPSRHQAETREISAGRRRAELADAAHRIGRRGVMAEVIALRCKFSARPRSAEAATTIAYRATRRAARLRQQFHRAIDVLVLSGGFDEALAILNDRKGELARRMAKAEVDGLARLREGSSRRGRSA